MSKTYTEAELDKIMDKIFEDDYKTKTIGDCIRGMNNRELAVFLKPFMTRFLTEDEIVAWLEEDAEG